MAIFMRDKLSNHFPHKEEAVKVYLRTTPNIVIKSALNATKKAPINGCLSIKLLNCFISIKF